MAIVPIEVVEIGDIDFEKNTAALELANACQKEFEFVKLPPQQAAILNMHAYRRVKADDLLDQMENLRATIRGFHPFLIAVVDSHLDGSKYGNLFGSHRASKGLAITTTADVPDVIIPKDRMVAYFLYYLARYCLSFLAPDHRNHEESRGCVFDRKLNKQDIVQSMRGRALCDECRRTLVNQQSSLSPQQFSALDTIFSLAGRILNDGIEPSGRQRAFIGSSTEGLEIANKLQELLAHDLSVVVWNQGTVFGLGTATLEALEAAVLEYQFGIFVFTPDDQLQSRGETKPVARDNVLFELGMFIGKLGRHKAFAVHPGKRAVALPSDLLGITTATYDPNERNLAAALGPVCNQIRAAVKSIRR